MRWWCKIILCKYNGKTWKLNVAKGKEMLCWAEGIWRQLQTVWNCHNTQFALMETPPTASGKTALLSASTPYYNYADCMVMTWTTRPYSYSQNWKPEFNKGELRLPNSVIISHKMQLPRNLPQTQQWKITQNLLHSFASMQSSYEVQAVRAEFWFRF